MVPLIRSVSMLERWVGACPLILQDGNDQPQLQNALLRDRSATGCLYEQDVRLYEQDVPSTDATHIRDEANIRDEIHIRDVTHMKASRYEQGMPNTAPLAMPNTAPLVMLSVDRFVSGRFDEVWLASSQWARPQ